MFDYSHSELQNIDGVLETKLAWASDRRVETEQMALDASRLLSCVDSRVGDYVNQGFFKRCWFGLSGKNGAIERANQHDLLEMQKYAWRYISLLQERNLLLAHSMIVVKNNLLTLAVQQEEVRNEIARLAGRIADRFFALEERVTDLEVSRNIHGWLLTIDTRDYDEHFSENLRLLRVVNDFYKLKPDSWNINELKYLQKALKEVGLNPKSKISIAKFVESVIDEINASDYNTFESLMSPNSSSMIDNSFVIEAISAPVFSSMYHIKDNYTISSRVIRSLQKSMNISQSDAIKIILSDFIEEHGVDTSVEVPLKDLATEVLSCFSIVDRLYSNSNSNSNSSKNGEQNGSLSVSVGALSECISSCDTVSDDNNLVPVEDKRGMPDECYAFYSGVISVIIPDHKVYMPWSLQSVGGHASADVIQWFEENASDRNSDASLMMGFISLSRGDMKAAVDWFDLVDPEVQPVAERMQWFSRAVLLARCLDEEQVPKMGDIYVGGGMPSDKLANALPSFQVLLDDIAFSIIDTTLFGSCKDGVALTLRGIYWRIYGEVGFISWSELADKGWIIVDKGNDVEFSNGKKFSLVGSSINASSFIKIISIIRGMKEYLM